MNVLLISGSFPPLKCGVGDYTQKLIESIASEECKVTLLTSNSKVDCESNEYVQIHNYVKKWTGLSIIKTIFREVKKDYDLIHIQFPTINYDCNNWGWVIIPLILRIMGKKCIYTLHEYFDSYHRLPAIVFSNRVIVVDKEFMSHINKQYHNLFKQKINYIPIASNIPKSKSGIEEVNHLRTNILSKCDNNCEYIISYFGFLNKNKKVELILESMHELKKEGKLKTAFMIIGDYYAVNDELIEYQEMLRKLIIEYELVDFVYITGYVDEDKVGDYFRTSDVALLLFENGVSARNGSFLAAKQENIPVFTTQPMNLEIDFGPNVYFISNTIKDIKRIFLGVQTGIFKKNYIENYYGNTWSDVADNHLELYKQLKFGRNSKI